MQHELISLLHLCESRNPVINDVLKKLNIKFSYHYLQNEDKLLNYIMQGKQAILLVDQQFINWTVNVLQKFKSENVLLIFIGSNEVSEEFSSYIFDIISTPINNTRLALTLTNAHAQLQMKQEINRLQDTLSLQNKELHELNNIGIALSAERDSDTLLELILSKSREITHADAGSLYLVEAKKDVPPDENNYFANKQLRFKLAHCDSVKSVVMYRKKAYN